MRYNGNKIITDKDILFTSSKNQLTTLGETLENQQAQIDDLKSNIKWMYKYGALGGGTGGNGGGGTSSSFKVLVYKGTEVVKSGTTLFYKSAGSYPISVKILMGGSSQYKVEINYNGASSTPIYVGAEDDFTANKTVQFPENGTLTIRVTNQDTGEPYIENDSPVLSFPCIVTAYDFNAYYVLGDDTTTTDELTEYHSVNGSIFMSGIKNQGLMLALDYSIAVDIEETATILKYNDFEGKEWTLRGIESQIKKGSHILLLPLAADIKDFLSHPENAAYKKVSLSVQIRMANNTTSEDPFVITFADNLIPSDLYLKVTTSSGTLVSGGLSNALDIVTNLEDDDKFNPGNIVFGVTPYNGAQDKTRPYTLSFSLYDSSDNFTTPIDSESGIQVVDQELTKISIPCGNDGIKKLKFNLTLTSTNQQVEVVYYMNVREFISDFKWYPNGKTPTLSNYYRYSIGTQNIEGLTATRTIDKNINSPVTNISLTSINTLIDNSRNDVTDCFFNIGIQYSQSNDTTKPICSFNTIGSTNGIKKPGSIFIFQDKIVITSTDTNVLSNGTVRMGNVRQSCQIFVPLADVVDKTIQENNHLISILRKIENHEGNNYWKSVYAFVDGVFDGVMNNFMSQSELFDSVTFYPGNYAINLVDTSFWPHDDNTTENNYIIDNDVVCFWYTYDERMRSNDGTTKYDEHQIALYNYLTGDNFFVDEDNYVNYKSDDIPENIAENIDIPVMILSFDDVNGGIGGGFSGRNVDNFKNFISASYEEEQTGIPTHLPVHVQYGDGMKKPQYIKLPGSDKIADFYLDIQGSSTRSFKCKNFELTAPDNADPDNKVYVYSPNNDPDPANTEAFLPEQSFTLKADVVDSSHTNNNAMGKFIDENTTPFADAEKLQNSRYKSRLKNCLTGFPILLFLKTQYYSDDDRTLTLENRYFLGIYNFNLGRGSAFNMGYKNMNALDDVIANSSKGFNIFEISTTQNTYVDDIQVAEVQGNNEHFDFSQYNKSILFKAEEIPNDKTYMWGDFVHNPSYINKNALEDNITNFVKDIALSGGYIFELLQKDFSTSPDDNYGYDEKYSAYQSDGVTPKTQVPNYRYQYSRSFNTDGTQSSEYTLQQPTANLQNHLLNALIDYEDDEGVHNIPIVDYTSLTEYYTTCMVFGLIDSVQKNLNIKSWKTTNNKSRWYLAFYDMDTGLGINNAGNWINFFAFSDYWKTTITKNIKGINELSETKIYRDWAPMSSNEAGSFFDVPSSYLFAVAKYGYTVLRAMFQGSDLVNTFMQSHDPSNIYGVWRKKNAPLETADKFVDKYFVGHLKNMPEGIFNLNYRYKYFVKNDANNPTGFDSINFSKFHGRKVAYTRYWLDGRLHILDAYFNVEGANSMLPNGIIAPMITSDEYRPNDNPDVYILHEIFSNTTVGQQYVESSKGGLIVTSRPLSPCIIKNANAESPVYLFPDTQQPCQIQLRVAGNQTSLMGGSDSWTNLNSINQLITSSGTLYINSKHLEEIVGNDRECHQWTFTIPSIRKISLTGSLYSGDINLATNQENKIYYNNLTDVDISNSQINLTLNDVPVMSVRALNKPSGSLIMQNLSQIENVEVSGTFDTLTLCGWGNNISIPAASSGKVDCQTVTVTNDVSRFPDAEITISNNPTLTTLNLSGYNYINVSGCPMLEIINLSECDLKSIKISMPSNKNKDVFVNIKSTIDVPEEGIIDLSMHPHLEQMQFSNCNVKQIIVGDNLEIELPEAAFANSTKLEKIVTGEGTKLYLTGPQTFMACSNFSLYDEENDKYLPLHVQMGTTSLRGTFSCYNAEKGQITYTQAANFFQTIRDDIQETIINGRTYYLPPTYYVTNIDGLFRNQQINYTVKRGLEEYKNQTCSIGLSVFPKCYSIQNAFTQNSIGFLNKYMFYENITHANGTLETYMGWSKPGNATYSMAIDNFGTIPTTIDLLQYQLFNINAIDFNGTELFFINPDESTDGENMSIITNVKINDFFTSEFNFNLDNAERNHLSTITNFNTLAAINNIKIIYDFSELFNSPKYDATTHDIVRDGSNNIIYGTAWGSQITLSRFMNREYYVDSWANVNYMFSNITLAGEIYDVFDSFAPINVEENERNALDIATFINWDRLNKVTILYHSNLIYNGNAHGFAAGLSCKKHVSFSAFKSINEKLLNAPNLKYVGSIFKNCVVFMDNVDDEFTFVNDSYTANNEVLESISGLYSSLRIAEEMMDENHPIKVSHKLMAPFKNVKSYVETFANWYFKYPLSFDFFNKRKENISASGNKQIITYTYERNIIDLYRCFANIKFEKARAYKSYGVYDESGFNVNGSYFRNRTIVNDVTTFDTTDEYDDAWIAEQPGYSLDYSDEDVVVETASDVASAFLRNIPANKIDTSGCFVAPDILYSLTSGGCFDEIFLHNQNYAGKPDFNTFTGTIPKHMMKNMPTRTFKGLFDMLNIVPIHYIDIMNDDGILDKYYYYVPEKFSDADDFGDTFTFNLLFPRHDFSDPANKWREFFLLVTENSLPNMMKLDNTLPSSRYDTVQTALLYGSLEFPPIYQYDSHLRFNIIGQYDETGSEPYMKLGIDVQRFKTMKYDGILNSWYAMMYYGHLILNDDHGWNESKLYNRESYVYTVRDLDYKYVMNISKNIRINMPIDNKHYMSVSTQIRTTINKECLLLSTNFSDPAEVAEIYGPNFRIWSE